MDRTQIKSKEWLRQRNLVAEKVGPFACLFMCFLNITGTSGRQTLYHCTSTQTNTEMHQSDDFFYLIYCNNILLSLNTPGIRPFVSTAISPRETQCNQAKTVMTVMFRYPCVLKMIQALAFDFHVKTLENVLWQNFEIYMFLTCVILRVNRCDVHLKRAHIAFVANSKNCQNPRTQITSFNFGYMTAPESHRISTKQWKCCWQKDFISLRYSKPPSIRL